MKKTRFEIVTGPHASETVPATNGRHVYSIYAEHMFQAHDLVHERFPDVEIISVNIRELPSNLELIDNRKTS